MDLYPINWLTAMWAAVVAVLLTIAALSALLAALRGGAAARGHLLVALLAVAAAGTGVFELLLAQARSVDQYASLLRAAHVPVGLLVLVIPWLVVVLFGVGRRWLAVLANLIWGSALVLNVLEPYSRVYGAIRGIERVTVLGGTDFTWVSGTGQPARWLGYAGVLVTLAFLGDAVVRLWRHGDLRRAAVVGACLGISLGIGLFHSMLVEAGLLRSPYLISVAFLVIMAGVAFEMIRDAARSHSLDERVRVQEVEVAHLSRQSMLREMSVSIAHEVSQPISAILNNAQAALSFLDRDPPDLEEVREAIVEIVEMDRHATEVVSGFARVLKTDESRAELLDLNRVVSDVLELARSDLARRGVHSSTDLQDRLPEIRGDRVLLSMVLLNLIRNAAEAMTPMDRGERHLVVVTRGDDGAIRLTVSDTGPGVPEADRERIFDPFFTTREGGTGLGLAVSRTLTELHGGRVWSEAGPGDRGTSMHILIPTTDRARP